MGSDDTRGTTSAEVGKRVRARRDSRGITADELAAAVTARGVVLGRSALTQIENGNRRVTVDELVALARSLGVTAHDLLGWNASADAPELSPVDRQRMAFFGPEGVQYVEALAQERAATAAREAVEQRLRELGLVSDDA